MNFLIAKSRKKGMRMKNLQIQIDKLTKEKEK